MLTTDKFPQFDESTTPEDGLPPFSSQTEQHLVKAFGFCFTILDGQSGRVVFEAPDQPACDWTLRGELCKEVARRGKPEFIDDEDPFLVLAIPFSGKQGRSRVAVGTFVARAIDLDEDISRAAETLGMRTEDATDWACNQSVWPPQAIQQVCDLTLAEVQSKQEIEKLQKEASDLSVNLSETYEEISLLYRLTQNLRLSETDEGLGRIALEWLEDVVPAAGMALQLTPVGDHDPTLTHNLRTSSNLLTHGQCPLDNARFTALIEQSGAAELNHPLVVNRPATESPDWPCPEVRQIIAVSLAEGDNLFGWLAIFNHVDDGEFGTVEASLLSSVAAILGIHSGNIELYRQQSDTMAGIVRTLTSVIDAKDPYTCGHSDRVARVAVCLAEELDCDAEMVQSMYLSGLLHDIGKVGIEDSVLRKPGKLTDEEYEHIKQHVNIGHKIIFDLGKLENVLPVVLHHHESWDGGGYPKQLGAEAIPLSARIVAVADAFDAMGSDRPYRMGMPDEKIDKIFRKGAGQQWDPDVVAAFFRIRNDVREIAKTQYVRDEDKVEQLS
jgi:HD-GYP domain-containing protein (c-di-GMP phosphodiesterase class II)